MMRMNRWRPEVETLESMMLMSGIAGEAHRAAPATTSPLPNPLPLTGTIHAVLIRPTIYPTLVSGSGSLDKIGKVTLNGRLFGSEGYFPDELQGTLSSTKLGQLSVDVSVPLTTSGRGDYGIFGGTEAFVGETGMGKEAVHFHGRAFTLSFLG
jgi:hypothetical protein